VATNIGALAWMGEGKAGGTYDMYTYVPYEWKNITALRKRTPSTTQGLKKGSEDYFESASLAKTVDLICEGPIEGFSDKKGETIRFFQDARFDNQDFLKSIYLNDTVVMSERDGSFNFRVFDADLRRGETVQEIFPNSYRSHGKTIMYNSQLFPANANTPIELAGPSSEFISADSDYYEGAVEDGRLDNVSDMMRALELSYVGNGVVPGYNKRTTGHIDAKHKRVLHNKFKKQEKYLHPIVHTITDSNVEVVSIAINIHALSQIHVGKRSTETKPKGVNFLIYANNEGEPNIDDPPILEVTPEMARAFKAETGTDTENSSFTINGQTFDTYSGYNDYELIENDTGGFFVRRMKGLATSDYIFETVIHLPPNPKAGNRVIRVSRLDEDEEYHADDSVNVAVSLHSVTEIVPCQLYYPNSAVIGTTVDSRAFSTVPTRKYLLKLLKMKVPSNYLPDTKEYIGNWNGKFKAQHVINTASGDVLSGTSLNSYRVRKPKDISNDGNLVKINTTNKKWGSGSLYFTPSAGTSWGTDQEELKVLRAKDSFVTASRSASKGSLDRTDIAPFGTFGSSNFTIEFYIKASEAQVKNVYDLSSPSASADSAIGVAGVPKVIIASEQNAGLGWDIDTGVPDLGSMTASSDQIDTITGDDFTHLDTGRLVGGAWKVEVGTKDSSNEEHVDFGKVRFRAFMPGGNLFLQSMMSSLGRITSFTQGWDNDLKYELAAEVTSTSSIADNLWHHVAISRNGSSLSIFIDGVREDLATIQVEIFGFKFITNNNADGSVHGDVHKGEVQIGGTRTPYMSPSQHGVANKVYGTSFNGYLDEIMISREAKYIENFDSTPDQLSALMKHSFSTLLYVRGNDRDNNSTDIFDHTETTIDSSFKFDEDSEFDQAELQWTDNPAWILYDLITNKRYGLGKYNLKAHSVDKWNLYEIAKYCDEKVKTGFDPKYAAKEFQAVYLGGPPQGATLMSYSIAQGAGQAHILIGNPNSTSSLFSNQKEFEKQFPEFSTIALYDLNDAAAPVHRRIKYLRQGSNAANDNSQTQNERYISSDPNERLISYQAASKDVAGYAIVEIQRLVSTEEAIRLQPDIANWIKSKKSSVTNIKNKAEQVAREKQLIFHYIDDPSNAGSKVSKAFNVGSAINPNSLSGKASTEFYGNFDILEPRFSANLYITSEVDAYKLLNDIASIFRGITYFANGKIFAYFDKKRDAVLNFTNANVKDGNFIYAGSAKASRFTTCVVRYVDKYEQYKPKIEYIEDPDGIVKYGIIEKELVAFGCASRSQAKRLGRWFLYSSQYETESIEFSAGKESAYLRPGDVINVIDKTRTQKRFGGRIIDFVSGEQKIKIDLNLSKDYVGENIYITIIEDFEFSDSLDKKVDKVVLSEDSELLQKTVSDEDISNVRKSQVRKYKIKDIEADDSQVPAENRIVELESVDGGSIQDFGKIQIGSIFILNQKNTDVKVQENLFKVVNISEINDLEYKIQGLQYIESKFDLSDNKINQKLNIKYTKSPIEYSRPAKPIGVPRISVISINKGLERELTVSWESITPAPEKYKIVITLQGGASSPNSSSKNYGKKYVLEKAAKNSSLEIVDTSVSVNIGDYTGEIDVSVYSVDSEGNLDLIYY
tara:strand:+ start:10464 stop:15323 length:4860 start_codon:yes stop_codon:yes gene_type:complete